MARQGRNESLNAQRRRTRNAAETVKHSDAWLPIRPKQTHGELSHKSAVAHSSRVLVLASRRDPFEHANVFVPSAFFRRFWTRIPRKYSFTAWGLIMNIKDLTYLYLKSKDITPSIQIKHMALIVALLTRPMTLVSNVMNRYYPPHTVIIKRPDPIAMFAMCATLVLSLCLLVFLVTKFKWLNSINSPHCPGCKIEFTQPLILKAIRSNKCPKCNLEFSND